MLEIPGTLSLRLSNNDKWNAMLGRMSESPNVFEDGFELAGGCSWGKFKEEAARHCSVNKLLFVNIFWNKFAYRADDGDHWASPYEFVQARGGDCEDFAIAKYFTLLNLGVPEEDLGLLMVRDERSGKGHAVLLARYEGSDYVLDNVKNGLTRLSGIAQYQPLLLITGGKAMALLHKAETATA